MTLDSINSPIDLRKLTREELPPIAEELRQFILDSVSKTGGHLSSNLGTVELSIALHYVFNTPDDRIVWDVGHQSYPHKILTGRRNRMGSLRQFKGISGFPHRAESEFDAFGTGHSSTSISAAMLGLSVNDLTRILTLRLLILFIVLSAPLVCFMHLGGILNIVRL